MERFALSFARAEALEGGRGRGGRPSGADRPRDALDAALSEDAAVWLRGVGLMIADLAEGELLPGRVYLCGGGAQLPQLVASLNGDGWWRHLPFARQPQVRALAPDRRGRRARRKRPAHHAPGRDPHGARAPGVDPRRLHDRRRSARCAARCAPCTCEHRCPSSRSSSTSSPMTRSPRSSAACVPPRAGRWSSSPRGAAAPPRARWRCGSWPRLPPRRPAASRWWRTHRRGRWPARPASPRSHRSPRRPPGRCRTRQRQRRELRSAWCAGTPTRSPPQPACIRSRLRARVRAT